MTGEDGFFRTLYCASHARTAQAVAALTAAVQDEALEIWAMEQTRALWQADMDALYDAWIAAAGEDAGTVSGAPKVRAMQIIREMEGRGRGPYAGCVGWLGLDKDAVHLDTGITIRSMWLRDGKLCWQAGGGIVHDSDPELEWKEVCNKSAIMRLALRNEEECHVSAHR